MEWFKDAIGGKVLLNIQAGSVAASLLAKQLMGNAVLVGVMAKDFSDLNQGIQYIQSLQEQGVQVSAGLGDGSADQWERALKLAAETNPLHLNQVFPAAAISQHALKEKGLRTLVNGLIRPTGQPGMVNIATGPMSQNTPSADIPVETAAAMLKETGVLSIKFFPIQGTEKLDEVRLVARIAAKEGLILEPTGGITPDNVGDIVKVCLEEGVRWIMPHLYGSLKDKSTNDLNLDKLEKAYLQISSLF